MKYYPTNSTIGYDVSSKQDIIACLGDLGESLTSVEILNNGLVVGFIAEQGVTLGRVDYL